MANKINLDSLGRMKSRIGTILKTGLILIRDGLQGEWLFEKNPYDTSGKDNNGTLVGDANLSNDVLNLDGSGDYVNCGNDSSLVFEDAFSLTCWANMTDATNFHFSSKGITTSREFAWFVTNAHQFNLDIYSGAGNSVFLSRKSVATNYNSYEGSRKMFTVTYDGSGVYTGIKLYLDGQEIDMEGSSSGTWIGVSDSQEHFDIGNYYNDFGQSANGKISRFRAYNKELTAEEIKLIYDTEKDLSGIKNSIQWNKSWINYEWDNFQPNLVANWNFQERYNPVTYNTLEDYDENKTLYLPMSYIYDNIEVNRSGLNGEWLLSNDVEDSSSKNNTGI